MSPAFLDHATQPDRLEAGLQQRAFVIALRLGDGAETLEIGDADARGARS